MINRGQDDLFTFYHNTAIFTYVSDCFSFYLLHLFEFISFLPVCFETFWTIVISQFIDVDSQMAVAAPQSFFLLGQ